MIKVAVGRRLTWKPNSRSLASEWFKEVIKKEESRTTPGGVGEWARREREREREREGERETDRDREEGGEEK